MILRKPYAFFIKHFKLFNIILTILEVYMIYKLSFLVQFLFEYSSYPQGAIGRDLVGSLLSLRIFIIGIIIALFSFVLTFVLSFKKKPIKLYLFITIFNVALIIFLFVVRNYLEIMQMQIIENRTAFGIRDLVLISVIGSVLIAFLTSMRSLGFDIKKFEFGQDLHDLNISDDDNEEFEVQLDVDSQGFKRNLNRNIRYFKYFIQEHKISLIIVITLFIGFGSYLIYSRSGIYFNLVKVNQVVKTDNFSFGIDKSFITEKDYKGNSITNSDMTLIVIPIKIKTNNVQEKLNVTRFALNINNNKFYHTTVYKDKLIDLGINYNDSIIGTTFENYILVFEIPKSFASRNMYLEYNSENGKQIKFKVSKINLDSDDVRDENKYSVGETIEFNDNLIKKGNFFIGEINISDKFKLNYKFCVSNSECYNSYEYIVPNYKSNYDKTLIQIKGKLDLEKSSITDLDLGKFISNYGTIIYSINGETKINKINLNQVFPQKTKTDNTCYIEVLDEIKNAEHISLQIKLRNNIYIYDLK